MAPSTLLKCSANTAKALIFVINAILILVFTTAFRATDNNSPWRMVMLIGVVGNCFVACILGTVFGSLDCRKTNVELRASKDPIVFSIKLPIEETITPAHLEFFKHQPVTINASFIILSEISIDYVHNLGDEKLVPHPKANAKTSTEYTRAWLKQNTSNYFNNHQCMCNNSNTLFKNV